MTKQSTAEAIFFAAREKRTPEERDAYLDEACGGDGDLRRRVERLLSAHPQVGSFLEPAAAPSAETASYQNTREAVGTVIAERYKLLEEIGEGGMGTVFMAQQTEPVKRLVAVKLIKAGMDSKAVLTRFEAERQALALMDHPNIAKVFDAGATPEGRPFFVMELVKGVPITRYCDDHMLTPRERLELFVPVCHAVQHAHQKGIIHRDLKPSNVLVAQYDGQPVPKVIDFGVAKATGQPLTDKTLVTGFGAMVGTLEYMSPEQTEFNQLDIDTRSDVYALGVLLYELLTGSTPFSRKELEKAGLLEILRVIREQEPPRPSVKLSTTDALPAIAAKRGSEPRTLAGLLRHELDWIVMKALEKDRNRRYDTAAGFAADVQRYLAGEAVQAHPPSRTYRLRKFARKNRAALATAATIALLLLVGVVVSGWLAVKATRAEAVAEEKRIEADVNAKEAERNAFRFEGMKIVAEVERRDAQRAATSLQVDLDLVEMRQDQRIGLLRLCRTLRGMTELPKPHGTASDGTPAWMDGDIGEFERDLSGFITAAVLAAGQDYAPLLLPITHDGQEVRFVWVSPDSRTLLTLGADGTARLWDTRAARPISMLRTESEQVVCCGFNSDGRTVFTDDLKGVARIWDASTGTYRAQTAPRADRYGSIHDELKPSIFASQAVELVIVSPFRNRLLVWDCPRQGPYHMYSSAIRGISPVGVRPFLGRPVTGPCYRFPAVILPAHRSSPTLRRDHIPLPQRLPVHDRKLLAHHTGQLRLVLRQMIQHRRHRRLHLLERLVPAAQGPLPQKLPQALDQVQVRRVHRQPHQPELLVPAQPRLHHWLAVVPRPIDIKDERNRSLGRE
jgi:serine/threonine protein kinase